VVRDEAAALTAALSLPATAAQVDEGSKVLKVGHVPPAASASGRRGARDGPQKVAGVEERRGHAEVREALE
jgi:hypothetical protein